MLKTTTALLLSIITMLGFTANLALAQTQSSNRENGRGQQMSANKPPVKSTNDNKNVSNNSNDIEDIEARPVMNNDEPETENGGPSARALDRRSAVANAVQALLATPDRVGGIGAQVREIARAQNQNRDKLDQKIDAVANQPTLNRLLFGPNYSEIKAARTLMRENEQQLREAMTLKDQITDTTVKDTVQKQLDTLEKIDQQIDQQLTALENRFSILGWLMKLFTR